MSLTAEGIYLPHIDPDLGRLLIVCVFGNHESRTESASREKRKKKRKKPASKPGPRDVITRSLRRTTPALLKDRRHRRHIRRDWLRIRECFIYLRRDFVGPGVIHRHDGVWHPAQQVCRRQLGHFA